MQFRKIENVRNGGRYGEVRSRSGRDMIAIPRRAEGATALADTKYHNVILRTVNDVALVEARGSRLWLHANGLWSEQRSYRYFAWVGEGPCPDVCHYCGHNNGQNGESRYGWDCGQCGGN